jgi:leucyl aminopeptidase
MPLPHIAFAESGLPDTGIAVVLHADGAAFGSDAAALDQASGGAITRAIEKAAFKPKLLSMLDIVAPADCGLDRIVVVGIGKPAELTPKDWVRIGGAVQGKLAEVKATAATILGDWAPGEAPLASEAADLAFGTQLRGFTFDRYKTKKKDKDDDGEPKSSGWKSTS